MARVGDVGTALKVLQEAEASEDFSARPRKETFNALIKAYRTAVLKVRTIEEDEFDGDEGADEFDVRTDQSKKKDTFLKAPLA